MNNSNLTVGIIIALIIGGSMGYLGGKAAASTGVSEVIAKQVNEMTTMMSEDGMRMEKMGTMMIEGGKMLQERGAKYNDQGMIMKGKDLEVNGTKHQADGKSMMDLNSMMGMTEDGKMMDMPGMKM